MKKHRWIAIAQIELTDADCVEALSTGWINREITQKDIKEALQIGCFDCEEPLIYAMHKPCKPKP